MISASARRTIAALEIKRGSRALVCINMAYVGGKMMLARGLMHGWQLQIAAPDTDLSSILAQNQFDFSAMVPLQLQKLIDQPNGEQLLNNIHTLIIGGAAVSEALTQKIQTLKCRIYATYGMTETVSHIALQRLNGPDRSNHFTLLPDIAHQLDERGCLMLRGDVTQQEWIVTNDLVAFQNDRDFKVLGRADHVINTGGVKVQIESLEARIQATGLFDSKGIAIASLPDSKLGSKVVLVVEGEVKDQDYLMTTLKQQLPLYHNPRAIFSINRLPRTASDKLDRLSLLEWLKKKT